MKVWTYGEILDKITLDLDLQNEVNITPAEMVGYCNEAIAAAYAEILKINEDYFKTSASISLVSGTATYALPSAIYASKIRALIYTNGSLIYPIRRMRSSSNELHTDFETTNLYGQSEYYRYFITNASVSDGFKITICPPARETGAYVKVWYLRVPSYLDPAVDNTSSKIDIPEFYTFIIQFMKLRCLEKEGTDPRLDRTAAILADLKNQMIDTLTEKVPDDDNELLPDFSFYSELA